jgi:biopolymer transport protein ExbD
MKLFEDTRLSIQGAISERLSASRSSMSALRMAPMIDMIFLLLIFFLLTARFRPREDFLPMQLELSSLAAATRPSLVEPFTIYISPARQGCKVQLSRDLTVSIAETEPQAGLALLVDKLEVSFREQKRNAGDPLEIVCDGDVKWQYTARIYSVLYGMGITDITFRMTD